jgi:septal ring factor EnvC (AmiA/AmiB activator)
MITDAKDVLSIVARLRGAIARGDIGEACCDGIALGRFSERLRLRIHSFDNHILKENKRIAGKKKNNKDRKTLSQNKRTKCREKFAEFTPEEKKDLGLEKTYEEVGELVQQSLKLSEPIPGNTVRRYISKK